MTEERDAGNQYRVQFKLDCGISISADMTRCKESEGATALAELRKFVKTLEKKLQ